MFEATELSEHDWEMLQRAKRNGRMPYQQAIADCNPAGRNHWLNRRAKTDQMMRLLSRHEDNPIFFNADGTMTERGEQYIDGVLEKLSGARYQRLRLGKWAEAQGTVYPDFDPVVHWVDPFPIPQDWRRIRSIDFGFENAFVCQWWAMDHDDRMYMYREIYMSRRIVEDHAKQIKALSENDGSIEATVADHDAEDRATLSRHNIETIPARKSIRAGIDAVTARLKKSPDGRPRLFVFRDATVETDTRLVNEKKPTSTADEFEAYIWPTHKETANARNKKETPLDRDNHGMDGMRYAVAYVDNIGDGTMPLDVIATGADDDIVDDILSRGIDLTDEALWSDV
jgi:phage terminase large subunit